VGIVSNTSHREELPRWESEGYQTEVKIGEGNRVDGVKIEQNQGWYLDRFYKRIKTKYSERKEGRDQTTREIP
jgi:hypothetical protein